MIKKLKDIFYDLNDILVALIIVAAAALVIATNIESILAYPSVIAEEIQLPQEDTPTDYAENPPIDDEDVAEDGDEGTGADAGDQDASGDGQDASGSGQDTSGDGVSGNEGSGGGVSGSEGSGGSGSGEVVNYTITVQYGMTGDQIADLVVEKGLFNSRQEFNSAVAAAGKEGRLQAGTFTIPSNATPAEVISILTK